MSPVFAQQAALLRESLAESLALAPSPSEIGEPLAVSLLAELAQQRQIVGGVLPLQGMQVDRSGEAEVLLPEQP